MQVIVSYLPGLAMMCLVICAPNAAKSGATDAKKAAAKKEPSPKKPKAEAKKKPEPEQTLHDFDKETEGEEEEEEEEEDDEQEEEEEKHENSNSSGSKVSGRGRGRGRGNAKAKGRGSKTQKAKAKSAPMKEQPMKAPKGNPSSKDDEGTVATKKDLANAINTLKYNADELKNKKGSPEDIESAKTLLAHYKTLSHSAERADFCEKLKKHGLKGLPKHLHINDSVTDVNDNVASFVMNFHSARDIFRMEGRSEPRKALCLIPHA